MGSAYTTRRREQENTCGCRSRLLHWNVLWGGRRGPTRAGTRSRPPSSAVIPTSSSSARHPPGPRLDSLERGWGRGGRQRGSSTTRGTTTGTSWSCSHGGQSGGLRSRSATAPRSTSGSSDRAVPSGLLVVDGQSKVTRSRTPLLLDVAGACRRAADEGTPFDAVLGDFNARRPEPWVRRRARGGGRLRAGLLVLRGLARDLAGAAAGLRHRPRLGPRRVRVLSCSLFASPASDHRGQFVCLGLPGAARRDNGPRRRVGSHLVKGFESINHTPARVAFNRRCATRVRAATGLPASRLAAAQSSRTSTSMTPPSESIEPGVPAIRPPGRLRRRWRLTTSVRVAQVFLPGSVTVSRVLDRPPRC